MITSLLALGIGANQARAQIQIFLVPGLGENSSYGDWYALRSDLSSSFSITLHTPSLTTTNPLGSQSGELASAMSGYSASSIISVSHSNGGLVARERAKASAAKGIVTFGTPHSGVPLINNISSFAGYLDGTTASILYDLPNAFWNRCDYFDLLCDSSYEIFQSLIDGLVIPTMGDWLLENYLSPIQTIGDDTPGSSFLDSLNSSAGLSNEASHVPYRGGLAITTNNYYEGAFIRLIDDPATTASIAETVYDLGIASYDIADYVQSDADERFYECAYGYADCDWTQYYYTQDLADAFANVAFYLLDYEYYWCSYVSGGACAANDDFIPVSSQTYPGAGLGTVAVLSIASHVEEQSDAAIISALHSMVQTVIQGP